ncbi:uncharacterized protein BDZ99DRAFT_460568 [Mytilinidion resinicola]|uniref:Uncharacterized protein n=1 Tax=Mytilinidion resinicola TaxID=574789 RepID=A0A6A6YXL9_9PEZI|nr:uncharacterized protein BDZ99DRAFT_460568 [Mytilinidion resinicola]KAF2813308.1 hypothetical protein BDZ99DRAFT_460568 [Mytilinidion resinicola]
MATYKPSKIVTAHSHTLVLSSLPTSSYGTNMNTLVFTTYDIIPFNHQNHTHPPDY